jgi:hypothetical protein
MKDMERAALPQKKVFGLLVGIKPENAFTLVIPFRRFLNDRINSVAEKDYKKLTESLMKDYG